jgi:hypothetical protein
LQSGKSLYEGDHNGKLLKSAATSCNRLRSKKFL